MSVNQADRYIPRSEIEMNLLTTDSEWGRDSVSDDLKDRLKKYYQKPDGDIQEESYWGILNYFTRDLRLGNLGSAELEEARHYLNLANDLLLQDQIESFIIALERVAGILELSQSKSGFLRKWMQTLRSENVNSEVEPEKKSFFGRRRS